MNKYSRVYNRKDKFKYRLIDDPNKVARNISYLQDALTCRNMILDAKESRSMNQFLLNT